MRLYVSDLPLTT